MGAVDRRVSGGDEPDVPLRGRGAGGARGAAPAAHAGAASAAHAAARAQGHLGRRRPAGIYDGTKRYTK